MRILYKGPVQVRVSDYTLKGTAQIARAQGIIRQNETGDERSFESILFSAEAAALLNEGGN